MNSPHKIQNRVCYYILYSFAANFIVIRLLCFVHAKKTYKTCCSLICQSEFNKRDDIWLHTLWVIIGIWTVFQSHIDKKNWCIWFNTFCVYYQFMNPSDRIILFDVLFLFLSLTPLSIKWTNAYLNFIFMGGKIMEPFISFYCSLFNKHNLSFYCAV